MLAALLIGRQHKLSGIQSRGGLDGSFGKLLDAKIATSCENEARAVLNAAGGKVDPTMSLHSLFGHRSVASVKKGVDGGDIVGHEEYTKG